MYRDIDICVEKLQLTFYGSAVYLDSQASEKIPVHNCYKPFEADILDILPSMWLLVNLDYTHLSLNKNKLFYIQPIEIITIF